MEDFELFKKKIQHENNAGYYDLNKDWNRKTANKIEASYSKGNVTIKYINNGYLYNCGDLVSVMIEGKKLGNSDEEYLELFNALGYETEEQERERLSKEIIKLSKITCIEELVEQLSTEEEIEIYETESINFFTQCSYCIYRTICQYEDYSISSEMEVANSEGDTIASIDLSDCSDEETKGKIKETLEKVNFNFPIYYMLRK